ncbi:hypothetical protein SESBI_05130 [Sesbania bispinosa]|nr:hypothetical protein SESBI_05130 [Sesbania bispinosa]
MREREAMAAFGMARCCHRSLSRSTTVERPHLAAVDHHHCAATTASSQQHPLLAAVSPRPRHHRAVVVLHLLAVKRSQPCAARRRSRCGQQRRCGPLPWPPSFTPRGQRWPLQLHRACSAVPFLSLVAALLHA